MIITQGVSMGVYIKGMEMPKSCLSCPLQGGTADCRLTQKTYNWGLSERPSDCPLVPIPPHGRLIDADALEKDIDKYIGGEESRSRFHHWVQVQSVVITGNKGEQT